MLATQNGVSLLLQWVLVLVVATATCLALTSMPDPGPEGGTNQIHPAWQYGDIHENPYFQSLLQDLRQAEVEKRVPSSASFMGVRGKKAPSGFFGMRGKKDDAGEEKFLLLGREHCTDIDIPNRLCWQIRTNSSLVLPKKNLDVVYSTDTVLCGQFVDEDWTDEYDLMEKRAPVAGFLGMRGKKRPGSAGSGFFGVRGKKGPSHTNFFGVRGKKSGGSDEDLDSLFRALLMRAPQSWASDADSIELQKKAPGSGFMGMRGKKDGSWSAALGTGSPFTAEKMQRVGKQTNEKVKKIPEKTQKHTKLL
ncbi:hypothetical protein B566_EDAN015209 [Ephemera danica]|nr:hypothetical protein B566_EDAN015209 [Ephemera danica]